MEINRNNYEIYFLDYHEGNLSATQQAELFLFLEQHPDLKEELESFDLVKLPSSTISFEGKENLKRALITKENVQQYLIGNLEGDLNKEEKHELNKFLFQHPEFKKEEQLFAQTKLSPDKAIVFPAKSKLKHAVPISENKKRAFYFSVAAAACILLMMGVYFFNQHSNENMRANNETKKEVLPIAKNNNSTENNRRNASVENVNPVVKKDYAVEKSTLKNKRDLADQINVEKKEKKAKQHKNNMSRDFAEARTNSPASNELITPAEKKELAQIKTNETPDKKIEYVNLDLLREELKNTSDLNAYLDRVTSMESENNKNNSAAPVSKNKQERTPVLGFVARSISLLSNEDVTVRKQFNAEGDLVAYQLEAGKFKIGTPSNR
jgi:hypothetical protein